METIDYRPFKERVKDGVETFKMKASEVTRWVKDHPMESIAIGSSIVGTIAEGRRIGDRIERKREAKDLRTRVYCPDISGYVRLKHELSYKENLELRDRMRSGQTKFEALSSMGLLK